MSLDARSKDKDRIALSSSPSGRGLEELHHCTCLRMTWLEALEGLADNLWFRETEVADEQPIDHGNAIWPV